MTGIFLYIWEYLTKIKHSFLIRKYNFVKSNLKYNRIKIVLLEKDCSSKWLAEKINKDKSTVSRWCTNDMQPSIETLFQIAEILNVSPKDLLAEISN